MLNNKNHLFDWISYVNNNDDLLQSGIDTEEKAWTHWTNHGQREGRRFCSITDVNIPLHDKQYDSFDWNTYLEKYQDLKNIGFDTKEKAWQHWIKHGINEGRTFYNINDTLLDEQTEFGEFDHETYLANYSDLRECGISTREHAWFHWQNHGKNEGRIFYKMVDEEMQEKMEKFDWVTYINTYEDLSLSGISTKEHAWKHWITFGIREERTPEYKNSTKIHHARFGNLFFLNMVGHFIAIKNDLKMEYKYLDKYNQLGIDFFIGNTTYKEDFFLTDENFLDFINKNNENYIQKNIVFTNEMWCHSRDFCFLLEKYFKIEHIRNKIINANLFKLRYHDKNNDLYIHVRLGDTVDTYNYLPFEYYDSILSSIKFEKGYISSDTIKHGICKQLIKKYKLIATYDTDVNTIMFGSTCKHIVLSGGTFSWLIGFLGFFSDVYYPTARKGVWYGDIFVFTNWKGVYGPDSLHFDEKNNNDDNEDNSFL